MRMDAMPEPSLPSDEAEGDVRERRWRRLPMFLMLRARRADRRLGECAKSHVDG